MVATYQGTYTQQELLNAFGGDPSMTAWATQNPEAAGRMIDAQRMRAMSGQFGEQYGEALGMQRDVYGQFGEMAAGRGPSLAQAQLQQGMGQAEQAAVQAALQARGGSMAGGQQAALQASTALGGQAAMQAAQLRQQEQLAAMQAQAGMAGQMAGQGLQGQMGGEQLGLGHMQAGMEYELGRRGLEAEAKQAREERKLGWYEAGLPGTFPSDRNAKQNVEEADSNTLGTILDIVGGGSVLGLISDAEAKQNIRPGNLQASQAVGELNPYTFEYKAGYGPAGERQVGVMADEVRMAAPGLVENVGGVDHINTAKATGLTLAASADQEKRIRDLEIMLGSNGGQAGGMPAGFQAQGLGGAGPAAGAWDRDTYMGVNHPARRYG